MDDLISWLLSGPPWVQYRTRLDLLGQSESDTEVRAARQAMLTDLQVQGLVAELAEWPGVVLASHKSAGLQMHKLTFIADLGLRAGDPGVDKITTRIFERQSADGPFQMPMNISESYGGSGTDMLAWALCDAPVTLYGLLKLGFGSDPRVRKSAEYLMGLVREDGWPCAVSPELGKWRGPGRKDDPCPYANLVMLKALAQTEWRDSSATRAGAEAALSLWSESQARHPYMFYMGVDFRKLKAPFIWYDLLHVLVVLTQFPFLKGDPRLEEMLDLLASKAGPQGRYTPESIWKAWSGWDFGQKKESSRWLTFLAHRVLSNRKT
ncbi:MAG: hypothetical protein Q7U34_13365 [Anaerolineales bacterium]|nr:hypothetical protein [Anaerolineales bacterium]